MTVAALSVSPVAAQDAVDVEMAGSSITLNSLYTSQDSALFKPTAMEGLADAAASFTDFTLSFGTDPADPAFTYELVENDFTNHTSTLLRYNADDVNIFCSLSQQRCVVGIRRKDIDDGLVSEDIYFNIDFDGVSFQNHGEWMESEGAYQATYTYLQAIEEEVVPTVTSATGQVWMDRNLGASRVAQSTDDIESYGDLYQWGRGTDGHQYRDSNTTSTLSAEDAPGHSYFIIGSSDYGDWRQPENLALWQGVDGINNPCPTGFRLPTEEEWRAETDMYGPKAVDVFNSPLKIPAAGYRLFDGVVIAEGTAAVLWSSTSALSQNSMVVALLFDYDAIGHDGVSRTEGSSVRCIKD